MKTAAVLVAALTVTAVAQPTVTIEKVARSSGNSIFSRDMTLTDTVPGRDFPFVFWSSSDPPSPAINEAGEVVFEGFSSSQFGVNNSGAAFGIYVKRPGNPLAVLVDTTDSDNNGTGTPTFPVPGHPDARFFGFEAPLINNAGDVVFFARFVDLVTSVQGTGFYSTTTTGGPLVKIVDTSDTPAGHPSTSKFESFTFTVNNPSTFGASLNDLGEVVYWGQFCDSPPCTSTSRRNGVFGTTVSGVSHVLLADSSKTICPTGIPFGITCDPAQDEGFYEIRPEKGITNTGDVIFHGKIRRGGSSCCGGVFSIPVTGGTITTTAFRTQPAPPDGTSSYSDRFDEVAHNEAGTVLFLPRLGFGAPARFGVYASDLVDPTGDSHVRIADTVPGTGPAVPGIPPDGEFTSVAFPTMNDAGQMGFRATSSNSVDLNNDGIYAADSSGGPIRLVLDKLTTAPGLPDPARVTSFQASTGVAINAEGHMAFAGVGIDHLGSALRGIYFYDACAEEASRISDSTTALADLGVAFGGLPGSSFFEVYTRGEARSGQYQSINNNNQVVFLAKFSNFGWGIYVASVTTESSGAVTIECPADLILECPADTDPIVTGEATAGGCGTATVTFADSSEGGCGGAETITRTWTADNGAGSTASCVQTISVVDTTDPSLIGVPTDTNAECDAVPVPASVTATDACDAGSAVSFEELRIDGNCANNYTLIRIWTAMDACDNSVSADQAVGVADTTPPVITCPPDALDLECPADTSIAARGSASATDNCGGVTITSSDVSVPGPGATETVTRTWTATDDCGHTSSCDQVIEVVDTTAPVVTCSTATTVLWSPDHNLVPVGLTTSVDDGCDDVTAEGSLTLEVWSDETEIPDTGDGTGRHAPDAKDIDSGLRLRNERRGGEEGRVYLIIARAEDGSGNVGFGTCTVVVPHDQSTEGEDIVAVEAAVAEATFASTPGSTIGDKIAALVAQGWTQHGISGELGPKQ